MIDVTLPETTISSVVDGNNTPLQEGATTTSNKIVLMIEGTDDSAAVTGFQCVLDNLQQDLSICSTNPIVAENLQPGVHFFQISSIDLAGNMDVTPAVFSWNIVPDQSFGDDQILQQPSLQGEQQLTLPYQTNISPFMMSVVPNPKNDSTDATTLYESQQPLGPLPLSYQANSTQVSSPQYPTTTTNNPYLTPYEEQLQQYAQQQPLQQYSQNISDLQQPYSYPHSYSYLHNLSSFQYPSLQQQQQPFNHTLSGNNTTVISPHQPLQIQKQVQLPQAFTNISSLPTNSSLFTNSSFFTNSSLPTNSSFISPSNAINNTNVSSAVPRQQANHTLGNETYHRPYVISAQTGISKPAPPQTSEESPATKVSSNDTSSTAPVFEVTSKETILPPQDLNSSGLSLHAAGSRYNTS